MKKIYLLGTFIVGSFIVLKAQPTLTSANTNFQIGETFNVNNIAYVTPGNGGANVTWNFAGLNSSSSDIVSYISPSSTPFASDFPGANVTSGIQGEQYYTYFSANLTSLSLKGVGNPVGNIIYSDPKQLLTFPFTFNTTYTDNYTASYSTMGLPVIRTGTVKVTADGYGTLILPFATLNNVLRVFSVTNYTDEAVWTRSPTGIDTSYQWFLPGVHYPVMSLHRSVRGTEEYMAGEYLDKSSIGTNDFPDFAAHVTVSPNPAMDNAKVGYTLATSKSVKISLVNALGQTVIELLNMQQAAGDYSYNLNVKQLPKGLYLVLLEVENNSVTHKLIIQ